MKCGMHEYLRVRPRYPAVVRAGTRHGTCAGRRHVRPSRHIVALGINNLLALDARGREAAAPTSSGLTAQPTAYPVDRIPNPYSVTLIDIASSYYLFVRLLLAI